MISLQVQLKHEKTKKILRILQNSISSFFTAKYLFSSYRFLLLFMFDLGNKIQGTIKNSLQQITPTGVD